MANERESVAPASRELAGTVLDAFTRHRLVGIGESHGLQDHHDALQLLLADPRLPEVADNIVVEFGNARYQDTMDRFIAGQPVADADLRAAWRNTTQSPRQTWDAPVCEQFYRTGARGQPGAAGRPPDPRAARRPAHRLGRGHRRQRDRRLPGPAHRARGIGGGAAGAGQGPPGAAVLRRGPPGAPRPESAPAAGRFRRRWSRAARPKVTSPAATPAPGSRRDPVRTTRMGRAGHDRMPLQNRLLCATASAGHRRTRTQNGGYLRAAADQRQLQNVTASLGPHGGLRGRHAAVTAGYHLSKRHWNTVRSTAPCRITRCWS